MFEDSNTATNSSPFAVISCGFAMLSSGGAPTTNQGYLHPEETRIGFRQNFSKPIIQTATLASGVGGTSVSVTPEANEVLSKFSQVRAPLLEAFDVLRRFVGEDYSAHIDRFVDPYDGSKALIVVLESRLPYAQASFAIDRFCGEFWFRYMDELPVSVIFQAGD